jgi:hypothetical protein
MMRCGARKISGGRIERNEKEEDTSKESEKNQQGLFCEVVSA